MYDIVLDGLAYGPRDLPMAADRQWLRDAIAEALHGATEVALHDLAGRLLLALDGAPPGVVVRFGPSYDAEDPDLERVVRTRVASVIQATPEPSAALPDAVLRDERGGLRAPLEVELGQDGADVVLHGLVGEEDDSGDLLVRLALGDEKEDLLLL